MESSITVEVALPEPLTTTTKVRRARRAGLVAACERQLLEPSGRAAIFSTSMPASSPSAQIATAMPFLWATGGTLLEERATLVVELEELADDHEPFEGAVADRPDVPSVVASSRGGRRLPHTRAKRPEPRALLVDVGGTLLAEERFDVEAGFRVALRAMGAHEGAAKPLGADFRREAAHAHERDEELSMAAWLSARAETATVVAHDALEDLLWNSIVTLAPFDGVGVALARLGRAGIQIGAVSNAPFSARVLLAELERHELAAHLSFVLSSADVGYRKPSARIFRLAAERLGVPEEDVWFVGDTLGEDIAGAVAVDMTAVWFNPSAAARVASAPEPHHEVCHWNEIGALADRGLRR